MDAVLGVIVAIIVLIVLIVLIRSVRIVPQQQAYIVERLGKYLKTLGPGLNLLAPFVDRVRTKVDLREQVVSFPPQPVITSDNLVVSIDTVLYFQITDPARATYEIANFLQGIEQLTVTTLRNVIGSMDLERTLTSRDDINRQLRGVLDEATGKWGIRVNRVEIKAIEPPPSIRDSMEKQMRAERDRRAAILTAEGHKQSQILTAEGEKQSAILRAQGDRESRVLQAEGQAKAIRQVADAIHRANPDQKLLAYQYLQTLPQIAAGQSNKIWVIPAELTKALEGFGGAFGKMMGGGDGIESSAEYVPDDEVAGFAPEAEAEAEKAAQAAADAATEASAEVSGPDQGVKSEQPALPAAPVSASELTDPAPASQPAPAPAAPQAPATPPAPPAPSAQAAPPAAPAQAAPPAPPAAPAQPVTGQTPPPAGGVYRSSGQPPTAGR
jgi:regulator of protease activity HflC (stomatin/prohibitin superfamily)